MRYDYDLWNKYHSECVGKVQRFCELNKGKESLRKSVKCNSALCVMVNAMQDINAYFQNNIKSSAELCFLIRNIDVIITGILDINNLLLGVGLNKTEKAIERCFTDKQIICNFRTLRSLILAHPVDTHYINNRGESETVYLEDFRPFNSASDGFLIKKKCDYIKRMCKPETHMSYFEPLSESTEIIPVIKTIIKSIALLNTNIEEKSVILESGLASQPLILDKSSIEDYILSLDRELKKRYPSSVEDIEYADNKTEHYSIVYECLMYYSVHLSRSTHENYDKFLEYIKNELNKIETDLQQMKFDEDKYFKLLYNPDFADSLSYEKTKMEYLRDSSGSSYTEEYIGNQTEKDALWGVRCFRLLRPYIDQYISVDTSTSDKGLYCQYIAAVYLSNVEK